MLSYFTQDRLDIMAYAKLPRAIERREYVISNLETIIIVDHWPVKEI